MGTRRTIILSGAPGAGKSTVALALCQCFDRAVHLDVDNLRKVVVSGYLPPLPPSKEADAQFELTKQNVIAMTQNFVGADYRVVIDDVLDRPHVYSDGLAALKPYSVYLRPNLSVCLARNHERDSKNFDTRNLDSFIRSLYRRNSTKDLWESWDLVLDTSDMSVDNTVRAIQVAL